MSEQLRNEKEEKNEKDQGGWDEKWRRDPVDATMWSVILIWVGIVLLGAGVGWFERFETLPVWSIGFLGAGGIVLLAVAFRLLVPAYRRPLTGNLIFALVLLGIGLGELVSWAIVGPLILIVIGVGLLLWGVFLRR